MIPSEDPQAALTRICHSVFDILAGSTFHPMDDQLHLIYFTTLVKLY